MKVLIVKALIFTALICGVVAVFFANIDLKDKFVENYYSKFSSPKSGSMILGSSRALHNLKPTELFKKLDVKKPYLNFAFTMAHSPYGEIYLSAIKKKIDLKTKNGLFILEVNPYLLSIKKNKLELRESTSRISDQIMFNQSPNFEYILKNYPKPLYTLFSKKEDASIVFTSDGWFNYKNELGEKTVASNIPEGINAYKGVFKKAELSNSRVVYFIETIRYLKKFGSVIVVRLPITNEMLSLENEFYPNFDKLIDSVSISQDIQYINLGKDGEMYSFRDAHHLETNAAIKLSNNLNQKLINGGY